jgi:hypothetical protein
VGVTGYPAQPWDLHGHAYVGAWLVPRDRMPAPHSPATRPVTLFGRGIVGAAFFVYEEPSPLTYHEIMATVLVRQGWRLRVSITHIWVDSPASRDGGRDLWAIPKDLAVFDVVSHASYVARGIGSLGVGRVLRVGHAAARWSFETDGPLGFLHGRRPLLTLAMRPFRLLFGHR